MTSAAQHLPGALAKFGLYIKNYEESTRGNTKNLTSESSEDSQYSLPMESEVCNFGNSVICGSDDSVPSVPSMRKAITWDSIVQGEVEVKRTLEGLEGQIRSWYMKWIHEVYTPDIEKLEAHVSDMAGFLLDAVDEPNVMSLLEAYYQVNRVRFNDITQKDYAELARRTIASKQREWVESLPSDEFRFHKQLSEAHLRATHRILRALALKALNETGSAVFHMGEAQFSKRVTFLKPREAGRLLKRLPYIVRVETGEVWKGGFQPQGGHKSKASTWRWLPPL